MRSPAYLQEFTPVFRKVLALVLVGVLCLGGCFALGGCGTTSSSKSSSGTRAHSEADSSAPVATTYTAASTTSRPSVSPVSRDHYVDTANAKSATVLMYIVGSDLESEGGSATSNLQQMCQATLGSNVRILIQAGGCTSWQNSSMVNGTGRYEIANGKINLIQDLGKTDTLTSDALADFITWGASYAPADRIELIMWDHGGGTILGFGSDSYYENSILSLANIGEALDKAKIHLDFLGFDACLMGTVEMGYTARQWADYLIASEELEPSDGWQYSNWLTKLASDPSISTVDLGKVIVDDYIKTSETSTTNSNPNSTLSVIDLTKIDWLYSALSDYFGTITSNLSSTFDTISQARGMARDFGNDECDQIDMVDFLDRLGTDDAARAAASVESVVAYTASTSNLKGANGLAMYFPYKYPSYYQQVSNVLSTVGFSGNVKGFCDSFVSLRQDGKTSQDSSTGLISISSSSSTSASSSSSSSYDDDEYYYEDDYDDYRSTKSSSSAGASNSDSLESVSTADNVLPLTDKNGGKVLKLTDAQWDKVVYAELEVLMKDGSRNIDLGGDDVYDFDDDGDLVIDFDHKWYAINGQLVPFYSEGTNGDDNNWYTYGYIPAVLNGSKDIDIMVYFNKDNPDGKIVGYRYVTKNTPIVRGFGYNQFKDGDTIDFVVDTYDDNGKFLETTTFGNRITYSGSLTFTLESLTGKSLEVCYELEDVYGSEYVTEPISMQG